MKTEYLEDKGLYLARFNPGVYLIDGNVKVIDRYATEVNFKDIDGVKRITETPIVTHYEDADGNKKSVSDYQEELDLLYSKGRYDEYKERDVFGDIDDEYKYKKFCQTWNPCKRTVNQYSDPIKFEVIKSKYDTGCEYVRPVLGTENQYGIFIYRRNAFINRTVCDIFSSLGMELRHGVNYGETNNNKIWGNSNHSGCRYVVAFGCYPLNDSYGQRPDQKGTLDDLMACMNRDKDDLNRILRSKYASHFMDNVDFGAKDVLQALISIKSQLSKVKSMAKTSGNLRGVKNSVNNALVALQKKMSEATK